MSFLTGFVMGRVLGTNQGITDEATLNRLSILGGMMGNSPMGLVMTTVLAKQEAENAQQPSPTPTTPTPTPTVIQIEVPDLTHLHYKEAKRKLESLGLTVSKEELYSLSTEKNQVIRQKPEAGSIVPQGTVIILSVSLGSDLPSIPTSPPDEQPPAQDSEQPPQKALVGAGSGSGSSKKSH